MNLNTRAAIDAQREWDANRRDDQNHARLTGEHCRKLVVKVLWRRGDTLLPLTGEPFAYAGRWAKCPRCGAGPPSEVLTRHFPSMIEERPGEESDLYKHECEEGEHAN